MKDLLDLADNLKARFNALEREIFLLKLALNSTTVRDAVGVSKINVPEPKLFNATHNAKELENFM